MTVKRDAQKKSWTESFVQTTHRTTMKRGALRIEVSSASAGRRATATLSHDDDWHTRNASLPPIARACMDGLSTKLSILVTISVSRRFLIKAGRNSLARAWACVPQGC